MARTINLGGGRAARSRAESSGKGQKDVTVSEGDTQGIYTGGVGSVSGSSEQRAGTPQAQAESPAPTSITTKRPTALRAIVQAAKEVSVSQKLPNNIFRVSEPSKTTGISIIGGKTYREALLQPKKEDVGTPLSDALRDYSESVFTPEKQRLKTSTLAVIQAGEREEKYNKELFQKLKDQPQRSFETFVLAYPEGVRLSKETKAAKEGYAAAKADVNLSGRPLSAIPRLSGSVAQGFIDIPIEIAGIVEAGVTGGPLGAGRKIKKAGESFGEALGSIPEAVIGVTLIGQLGKGRTQDPSKLIDVTAMGLTFKAFGEGAKGIIEIPSKARTFSGVKPFKEIAFEEALGGKKAIREPIVEFSSKSKQASLLGGPESVFITKTKGAIKTEGAVFKYREPFESKSLSKVIESGDIVSLGETKVRGKTFEGLSVTKRQQRVGPLDLSKSKEVGFQVEGPIRDILETTAYGDIAITKSVVRKVPYLEAKYTAAKKALRPAGKPSKERALKLAEREDVYGRALPNIPELEAFAGRLSKLKTKGQESTSISVSQKVRERVGPSKVPDLEVDSLFIESRILGASFTPIRPKLKGFKRLSKKARREARFAEPTGFERSPFIGISEVELSLAPSPATVVKRKGFSTKFSSPTKLLAAPTLRLSFEGGKPLAKVEREGKEPIFYDIKVTDPTKFLKSIGRYEQAKKLGLITEKEVGGAGGTKQIQVQFQKQRLEEILGQKIKTKQPTKQIQVQKEKVRVRTKNEFKQEQLQEAKLKQILEMQAKPSQKTRLGFASATTSKQKPSQKARLSYFMDSPTLEKQRTKPIQIPATITQLGITEKTKTGTKTIFDSPIIPVPIIPLVPKKPKKIPPYELSFGYGYDRRDYNRYYGGRKYEYTPDFASAILGYTEKAKPKKDVFTGFEARPIISSKKLKGLI